MSKKCPKCNADNPDTVKFCGECGTQLSLAIPEVTKTLETPAQDLTRGSKFAGRYEIVEKLGTGGMGSVYRVEDTKIHEEVALKLIRPEIAADKKTIERFSNELKLARKIRHKNVSGMYDLGEAEGTHYITMEYISGEDLKSFIKRAAPISIERAISITKQVCEGLVEAHKLGIVHRDLKPSNIMIDKAGNARIMDFGIARSIKSEAITGENVIIGTPDYMSPEQVEGKEVDQQSDIYSLCVVLFEMLTGERPFQGDTSLSVAMKHRSEAPPNPKWLNDQIPDRLSRLVLICLEKEKEKRYQTAEDLLKALSNIDEKRIQIADKAKKKKSIAVLPFTNISADPEQEYFCDGMAEEIINSLTHIRDLKVIARTSSFMFKSKHEDMREIGKKLDVEHLLEGSVRKAGNRLRITAQLIDVTDGSHLWSEKYDRDMEDIFNVQDEISLAIVDKLKVKLFKREKNVLAKRYTEDVEAYNLYLKGMHFTYMGTARGFEEAYECFQQALQKDPDYALAYSGLASILICGTYFGGNVPPNEAIPRAREYLQKALELDNTLGEAHAWIGYIHTIYDWSWKEAENEYKLALELNPNDAYGRQLYAEFLTLTEQHDKAIIETKRALELDPLSSFMNAAIGQAYFYAGQYGRAVEELRTALKSDPNYFLSHMYLGYCFFQKSMFEEAIEESEKAVELSAKADWPVAILAFIYYKTGKKVEAEKLIEGLKKKSRDEYVPPICFFYMDLIQGKKDNALEWLEQACKEHDSFLLWMRVFPVDSFRIPDEPEFQELLKKYGLGERL